MPHKNDEGEQKDGIARIPIGWRTVLVVALLAAVELSLKHVGGFGWWAATERSERYGWRMLPDQDARSRDLSIAERINAYGFRDREWDPPISDGEGGWLKDDSLYRVAIVGNSFTYGTSVAIEDAYSRQIEQLIQAELDQRDVDKQALVMNFAVQGYCLEQMARVYEDLIRPFQVDLLIVPCHHHDAFPMAPAADDPDYDFRRWVIRSATYDMLVRHVINRWIPPPSMAVLATGKAAGEGGPDINWRQLDKDMMERPFSRQFRPLWDKAAQRMQSLDDMLAEDNGRLLLATLPRHRKYFKPDKVFDASSKWAGWVWPHKDRVSLSVPFERFRDEMQPVIDEIIAKDMGEDPPFDLSTLSWTDADGVAHPGDELQTAELSLHILEDMGHMTARGHRVMAEEVFATMLEDGLLPDAP